MADSGKELEVGVYQLPGEPAIVINGVPDIAPSGNDLVLIDVTGNTNSPANAACGEWLEGREIRKLFGGRYYSGTVTKFDKETGWYGVVYEDGDFEELEWTELEQVLMPLDITLPLKAVAQKIMRTNRKPTNIGEIGNAASQEPRVRRSITKGNKIEAQEQNAQVPN